MNPFRLAIYGTAVALAAFSTASAAETVELFNGKDLSGFKQRGGAAKYSVEDGAIVGRSVPDTSNTFLATEKEYADFELELDFKIDDPTFNSGVQIRSHARPFKDGEQVYGYQVEIDPRSDRRWTGGIYYEAGDENRKAGWLNDLEKNEAARNAFKLGEWNHLKIVARGRHIETWVNGVKAADFTDTDEKAFSPSGFIALQVHSVGSDKEPKEVRWRNIKLTELDPAESDGTAAAVEAGADAADVPPALRLFGRAVGAMFGINSQVEESDEFLHLLGSPAPAFELESLAGDKVRLADLRGKVVLLDFWATWCGPCVRAMPEIEKVHAEFADEPVVVLGVNQQEEREAINEFIKSKGFTFGQLLDKDGSVGDTFGANAIPHTVLIDQHGNIQSIHQGYAADMGRRMSGDIRKLLKGENLYDETKIAGARAKREQRRAEIHQQIELQHAERLEPVASAAGVEVNTYPSYSPPQWFEDPSTNERCLALLSGEKTLAVVRPNVSQVDEINLPVSDKMGIWDFCPVRGPEGMSWAIVGAQYDDDYKLDDFELQVVNSQGLAQWKTQLPTLDLDDYPGIDVIAGNLVGDARDEVVVLVRYEGLAQLAAAGPDGAERVLTVYDGNGNVHLRSWIPGKGNAAVFILPETDGTKLLLATDEGLVRYRVKLSEDE